MLCCRLWLRLCQRTGHPHHIWALNAWSINLQAVYHNCRSPPHQNWGLNTHAYKFRTTLYRAASASAEFFANITPAISPPGQLGKCICRHSWSQWGFRFWRMKVNVAKTISICYFSLAVPLPRVFPFVRPSTLACSHFSFHLYGLVYSCPLVSPFASSFSSSLLFFFWKRLMLPTPPPWRFQIRWIC